MEIILPILWQMVPYIWARSGRFSPRLLPQRATAATCIPSPKEKERLMTFIPTWWAAKASVPSFATMMETVRKPIRMKICSTNTLEATLNMFFAGSRVTRTFSLMIKGMLTKLSRFITERMLMRQAMTVPNTVARAAPVIPSLGKPRFPWISR